VALSHVILLLDLEVNDTDMSPWVEKDTRKILEVLSTPFLV